MATALHNLSGYDANNMPDASDMSIGIVVSEWNPDVTERLKNGVIETLKRLGVKDENRVVAYVPGSFELIYGAARMAQSMHVDAVIVLGCVVKGDTPHFDYVCSGVTQGIADLNQQGTIPFIFGLLTTDNMKQALDRAGGIHGNKGDEAAVTAVKMVQFAGKFAITE